MAVECFSTFESFWAAISKSVQHKNCPTYHPCCRVWVSRFQEVRRDTHTQKMTWRQALRSIKSSETDAKELLKAHMLDHQWGPPIHLNAPCSAKVSPAALNQALQKPLNSPPPQPSPGAFQFHTKHPIPSSPRSSPAQLQDQPSELRPQALPPKVTSQTQVETESRLPNPR
jgi:hypothetical protein